MVVRLFQNTIVLIMFIISVYTAKADVSNWYPANSDNEINNARFKNIVKDSYVFRNILSSKNFNDTRVDYGVQESFQKYGEIKSGSNSKCANNFKSTQDTDKIIKMKQEPNERLPSKGLHTRKGRIRYSESEIQRMFKSHNGSTAHRKGRLRSNARDERGFLSIIEVVQFNNSECLSSNGLSGSCYHEFECAQMRGTSVGLCEDGLGVCCVLQYTCGDETSAPRSWFTNPGFPTPSSERLACSFSIYKASEDVSQLRIDFEAFEVKPPTRGTCADDQFIISGQNMNSIVPIICGINNMQHIYFQVESAPGPIYLSLQTAKEGPRLFSIKITQLKPGDPLFAPSHCLQYFEGETGSFETFNYQDKSNIAVDKVPSYFNNLNYAICIARSSGFCTISYTNMDSNQEEIQFQLTNVERDGTALIPPDQAGAEIFNCPDDYITVNGIRLCGDKLNDATTIDDFTVNSPITELSTGPIIFTFRSNENVVGRGFKLFYKQNMCKPL